MVVLLLCFLFVVIVVVIFQVNDDLHVQGICTWTLSLPECIPDCKHVFVPLGLRWIDEDFGLFVFERLCSTLTTIIMIIIAVSNTNNSNSDNNNNGKNINNDNNNKNDDNNSNTNNNRKTAGMTNTSLSAQWP